MCWETIMSSRAPTALNILAQLPRHCPTLPRAQDTMVVPWGHQALRQQWQSRAAHSFPQSCSSACRFQRLQISPLNKRCGNIQYSQYSQSNPVRVLSEPPLHLPSRQQLSGDKSCFLNMEKKFPFSELYMAWGEKQAKNPIAQQWQVMSNFLISRTSKLHRNCFYNFHLQKKVGASKLYS